MGFNSRSTTSTSGSTMNDQGERYDASAGPGSGAVAAATANRSGTSSGTSSANSGDSMTGGTSSTTGASSMANPTASTSSATDTGLSSASTMYGVVATIDNVPRSQAGDMTSSSGATQSGTSGTSGSTGSANDMVYRINVRLDDGSSRSVYQETQPSYQIGDRVRLSNGALQRY
ncbi:hypothetical protein [Janthinobacterium agaricidamnosum]|nr:hypothetical protein [Janthinobacterium agaricidamnosum]